MPNSKNNTSGQRGAPKSQIDDYLPDYSPRPKYVIATIYPPADEPLASPEQEVVDRDRRPGPPRPAYKTASSHPDSDLPVRADDETFGTAWKESSLGSPTAARSGPESARFMSTSGAIGTIGHLSESATPVAEPPEREGPIRMELPRGKFRSLERNTSIISLLHHLHTCGFRGTCRINQEGTTIHLVFDQGRIILAEYNNLVGDPALGMICAHRFARIDAIVSELDEAQIRLSLEFNPSWKVRGNQEPSWIVSPGNVPETVVMGSEEPEPGAEEFPGECSGSGLLTSHFETGSPDLGGHPEESGERSDVPIPDKAGAPDWRKALFIPLCLSRDVPVLPKKPGPGAPPKQDEEVDGTAAVASAPVIPSPREVGGVSIAERGPEEPENVEGWKKALFMPVQSGEPAVTRSEGKPEESRQPRVSPVPDFELLSASSGLFDDIPVKRKVPRAPGPEPAEQWRSMGINRGENSSV